ncbi:MAG TPA: hypothetical protein VF823_12150, partial [Anaerolineales bacterium]
IEAEQRAYQNGGPATKLADIYRELAPALRLDEAQSWAIQQQECALEADLIRLVPGAVELVQKARAAGSRVVFLSDMYLPATFICEQLKRYHLWEDGDRCYVSCERGKTKLSGELFREMIREERVQPGQARHRGNSPESDTGPARRLGLQVDPFSGTDLNRYEAILESYAWKSEGLTSTLAGAARLARLEAAGKGERIEALQEVASGVAAPVLTGYMLWVLDRARQMGLKRLYFISRDGQVLLDIARRLAGPVAFGGALRYLYGSRQSWNLPAVLTGSDEELAWIWDSPDKLTVRSLLKRVHLSPEQVQDRLALTGIAVEDWSRPLRAAELNALQKGLLTPDSRELILEQARQKRRVLLAYLEQEGVLAGGPWGLVDLGWYGSMQNSICAVLEGSGTELPVGFYFALLKGKIANIQGLQREAYYFDEHRGLGYLGSGPEMIPLMEMFCAADHGTVMDFAEQDGRVVPLLKEESNRKVIDWGLPIFRSVVMSFLDQLLLDARLVNPRADIREAITELLSAFWLRPSQAEARAWSSFPWEDGLGAETYSSPLAQPFNWGDVGRAIVRGKVAAHHRAAWMQGSMILSPQPVRLALNKLARSLRFYRSWRYRAVTRLRNWRTRPNSKS